MKGEEAVSNLLVCHRMKSGGTCKALADLAHTRTANNPHKMSENERAGRSFLPHCSIDALGGRRSPSASHLAHLLLHCPPKRPDSASKHDSDGCMTTNSPIDLSVIPYVREFWILDFQ
jgi:hypothetical protein